METPKKPGKKSTASSKSTSLKNGGSQPADLKPKSSMDDDDDDFDMDMDDEFGKFESFDNYDEDDDY